jgi:Pyruvate/2-oxoacid:ferredoxin oxidoreductase delta subunit
MINKKIILESINGYSCPTCWIISSSKSFVKKEETENGLYDEIHKCKGCKTIYIIHKN